MLPRPPLKGESLKSRPLDFNSQEGPVVLSPPRKSRRVMLNREGLEGNHQVMNMGGVRQMGETTSHSSHVPMSVDLADLFGRRSPPRPTLNRLVIFTQKKKKVSNIKFRLNAGTASTSLHVCSTEMVWCICILMNKMTETRKATENLLTVLRALVSLV